MKISNLKQIIEAIEADLGHDDNAEFNLVELMWLLLDNGVLSVDDFRELTNFSSAYLHTANLLRQKKGLPLINIGDKIVLPSYEEELDG